MSKWMAVIAIEGDRGDRIGGLDRREGWVVVDIGGESVRRDGGGKWLGRGVGALVSEPWERKSRRENARTGGRARFRTD